MIWHPRVGQRVELRYRASLRPVAPHGQRGTVEVVGGGRMVNVQVEIDDGRVVIVPRGNLIREGVCTQL